MAKQIEIEIRGFKFVADLLEDKAPKTCKAFLSILPYEGIGDHQFWSGYGIQLHDTILTKMTEDHKLWPASNFPDRDENVNMFGSQGELALYPRGPGLFITYDKSRYFGPDGIEQSYHFAKITKDLDKLYEIGRTFRRQGGQKITIKLKE